MPDTGRGRELAGEDGITVWRDPAELFARAGAAPGDVNAILVTHAHFDHLGNVAAFPNATVYIQRREVEKWSWAVSLPRSMDWLKQGVSLDDLATLLRLAGDGGLAAGGRPRRERVPGHQPGARLRHAHLRPPARGDPQRDLGRLGGARYVMYLYANIEGVGGDGRYVPIGLAMGSQENCMLALDELMLPVTRRRDQQPILPGHERLLWDRHPSRRFPEGLHLAGGMPAPRGGERLPPGNVRPGGRRQPRMSSSVFHRDLRADYPSVVSAEGMYLRTESGQRILETAARRPWCSGTACGRSPTRSPGMAVSSASPTARRSPTRGRNSWLRRWWR